MDKVVKYSAYIICILLLSLLASACGILGTDASGPLQIRLANHSSRTMQQALVSFPGENVEYGSIISGGATSYKEVDEAYRYAYVEVMVEGRKLILQPVDYVGETTLKPGKYTYQLDINEENYQDESYPFALTLSLKKD